MNVDAMLESGAQLAEGSQPRVSTLDHPAMATEPIIALDASAGDAILDASALEMGAASRVVVTLVSMQLLGPPARPAPLATAKTIDYGFMPASDCTLEHLEAAHCSTRRTRGPAGKSPPELPA